MYGSLDKTKIQPADTTLTAYNGKPIECIGKMFIQCRYKGSGWHNKEFFIVDVEGPAIFGLESSKDLGLVTIHVDTLLQSEPHKNVDINTLKNRFPDLFDRIGSFEGEATLTLKEDAIPVIDRPRKFAIHMAEELKVELDKMEQEGIIRKVTEHTDWCSSITVPRKKDGSIRICIDPQKLNDNLKRFPHKIPTVEEVNPAMSSARYFSKLDAKAGYWSVHLDNNSQLLTTFRTPHGRYCWRRLPFGLKVSQDIFQARMDEILEGLNGVVGIADDITVFGETEKEHDANLIALMKRAQEKGLAFNSNKCHIKTDKITFFGNEYSKEGLRADPSKVEAIMNIPTPSNKKELQQFLGLMTYLSQFIPHFSEKTSDLRDILKKETPWYWEQHHQRCFEELKQSIKTSRALRFYNPKEDVELEVDASIKGLGAALIQNGRQ